MRAQAVSSSMPLSRGFAAADLGQEGQDYGRYHEDEKGGQREMAAGQRGGLQVTVGKGGDRAQGHA